MAKNRRRSRTMSLREAASVVFALVALLPAPWNEGVGVERWRAGGSGPPSRVPRGYGPWGLGLAFSPP